MYVARRPILSFSARVKMVQGHGSASSPGWCNRRHDVTSNSLGTIGIGGASLATKQESPRDPPPQGCFPAVADSPGLCSAHLLASVVSEAAGSCNVTGAWSCLGYSCASLHLVSVPELEQHALTDSVELASGGWLVVGRGTCCHWIVISQSPCHCRAFQV